MRIGIAGVSYIHTQIGTTLDQMTSTSDFHLISWQNGLGLGGSTLTLPLSISISRFPHTNSPSPAVILAVLIPVLLRRYYSSDLSEAAEDPQGPDAPRHSYDPLLAPRASLSLDGQEGRREFSSSDGSARIVGRFEDDDDEEEERPTLKEGAGSKRKVERLLGVQVN